MIGHVFMRHIDSLDGEMEVTIDSDFIWLHAGAFTLFLGASEARQLVVDASSAMQQAPADPLVVRLLSGDELQIDVQPHGEEPRLWISSGPAHIALRFGSAQLLVGAISEACAELRNIAAVNKEAGRC